MAELCRRTDTPRETVHHYLRLGLLTPPQKTFKNMAYYDQRHVEELLLIKRLRTESYYPLERIKQVLDAERLDASARALDLAGDILGQTAKLGGEVLSAKELMKRAGLTAEAVERYRAAGVLRPDTKGKYGALDLKIAQIAADAEQELGPALAPVLAERLGLFEEHIAALTKDEVRHFFAVVAGGIAPAEGVDLLKKGRDSIGRYLAFARARRLLEEIGAIFSEVEALASAEYRPAPALPAAQAKRCGEAAHRAKLERAAKKRDPAAEEALQIHLLLMGEYEALLERGRPDDPPALRLMRAEASIELAQYPEALSLLGSLPPGFGAPFRGLVEGAASLARLRDDLGAQIARAPSSEPWAPLMMLHGPSLRGLITGLARVFAASSKTGAVGSASALETELRFQTLLSRVYALTPSFFELSEAAGQARDRALAALEALTRLGDRARPGLVERYRLVIELPRPGSRA